MADVKISALPASTTPLAGTEVLPIVQSGTTVQVSVANLTAGRAIGATNATFTGALSVTPTWNAGATVFTGIGMNVTDTASAASSLLLDLQVGGSSKFSVDKTGNLTIAGPSITSPPNGTWGTPSAIELVAGGHIRWTGRGRIYSQATDSISILNSAASIAVRLGVDADDTLAQRNSTNAQAFRLYNTYTDASNYERGSIGWSSNTFVINGAEKAGTGTARNFSLRGSSASEIWTDNLALKSSNGTATGAYLTVFSTNVIGFRNAALSDAPRVVFGGDTSSFPALKRDGAGFSIRLADDSAATFIRHVPVTVANLPAAATAGAGARMMVSDATAPVFGNAVVGGGAVNVPVYSTGAAWNVG